MKILVTGAAGFIGSNLCESLLEDKHNVVGVDNLLTGKMDNLKRCSQVYDRRFDFYAEDVRKERVMNKIFKEHKPEIVFNQMASKKTICLKNPMEDLSINAGGTLNLLRVAYKNRVKKFIHASTGSVYGDTKIMKEGNPLQPVSYYGISKKTAEEYVEFFRRRFMSCKILRYFHVYGKYQDYSDKGGVVAIFINKFIKKEPITVYGDGTQMRCFTHVDDIVAVNKYLIDGTAPEVMNVCSDERIRLRDLIVLLQNSFGYINYLNYDSWQDGDIKEFDVENRVVKRITGIKFKDFVTGLNETIRYYKSVNKEE